MTITRGSGGAAIVEVDGSYQIRARTGLRVGDKFDITYYVIFDGIQEMISFEETCYTAAPMFKKVKDLDDQVIDAHERLLKKSRDFIKRHIEVIKPMECY